MTIVRRLSREGRMLGRCAGALLSDNAHAGKALRDFCERRCLPFFLFRERPRAHFYSGAGIGATVTA